MLLINELGEFLFTSYFLQKDQLVAMAGLEYLSQQLALSNVFMEFLQETDYRQPCLLETLLGYLRHLQKLACIYLF